MAGSAQVAGFLLVFYHHHFSSAADLHDFSSYFCTIDVWCADSSIRAVIHEENLVKGKLVPFGILSLILSFDFLNRNKASLGDFVLLSTSLYDRKLLFVHMALYYKIFHKKASICYTFPYMQTKVIERYFFFGLLFATFVFTFFIFRPFWVVLVLGICFAIVLHPIYIWLNSRRIRSSIAALITVLLFAVIVCGPILGISVMVFNQSEDVYHKVVDTEAIKPFTDSVNETVNEILPDGVDFDINTKVTDFISYLSSNIANIFKTTLSAFFSFILVLLIIFYGLKDGTAWKERIIALSPLGNSEDEKIINRLVNAVIKGYILIGIIQGILLGLGFWIFGVPHGALWGTVAAVASLIPTVGTALISVPAIIFLFLGDHTGAAIGLLAWAVVVVGLIDNFLSPLIVGTRINVSPILILFSVLGGISFLGPVGVLIGPLSVSLLYTLISIYTNEFKENVTV